MDAFLERVKTNLKYYSELPQQQRQKDFNEIYGNIDLKEVYLVELLIVKNLLEQEKATNNSVNIDDFIAKIDALYTEIEKSNSYEIAQKKEELGLLIVSLKLALNSPVYIDVDLEKLKDYDFNEKLGKYNQSNTQEPFYSTLKSLKNSLDLKIESLQKQLDELRKKINPLDKKTIELERIYNEYKENKIDGFEFLRQIPNLLENIEEKKSIVNSVNGVINIGDEASIALLDYRINQITTAFKVEKQAVEETIREFEHDISLMRTIAQNIDKNGRLIQSISDEQVEKYTDYIQSEIYDESAVINMIFGLLKEQARLARKQKIECIVNIVKEKISSKYQASVDKLKSQQAENRESQNSKYTELLEQAKRIIIFEMQNRETCDDLLIDKDNEIEYKLSQELCSDYVNQEKIKQAIEETKNESDECQLRLIICGLKYQLGDINDINIEHATKLIEQYINYYLECKNRIMKRKEKELEEEKNARQEFRTKISDTIQEAKSIIASVEEKISNCEIQYLTRNKREYLDNILNAYDGVEIEENEIEHFLKSYDLDFEILKLYKIYKKITRKVNELKSTIELIGEGLELEVQDYVDMRKNMNELPSLLREYAITEELYNQTQDKKIEALIEQSQSSNNIDESPCIVVFFEWEDGTTQVEKRLISDSKVYGKYGPSEIKKVNYMIDYLKNTMPDKIQKSAPVLGNSQKENRSKPLGYFGYRIQFGNSMRTAYRKLPSDALGTDKPVYLIESLGIKASNESDVYSDVTKNDAEIRKFIEKYESLRNASQEEKIAFMVRQQEHERRINELLQRERGDEGASIKK